MGLTPEDAAVSFAVIDKNGDGKLSIKEFVKLGREYFLTEDEKRVSRMFWGPLVNDHWWYDLNLPCSIFFLFLSTFNFQYHLYNYYYWYFILNSNWSTSASQFWIEIALKMSSNSIECLDLMTRSLDSIRNFDMEKNLVRNKNCSTNRRLSHRLEIVYWPKIYVWLNVYFLHGIKFFNWMLAMSKIWTPHFRFYWTDVIFFTIKSFILETVLRTLINE